MTKLEGVLNSFKCKKCCSKELSRKANLLECLKCGENYMITGEVIDFVSGNFSTQLDNIDYDKHYSVTEELSQSLFRELKSYLKDDLKESYGNLLEIGAGTGGFTMGLLTNIRADEAIITDISPKMLSICSSKISTSKILAKKILYATYSANENIFSPDYFDCIIGSFVLHHILKYEQFFNDSYTYLKTGGDFIFAEPNVKFHKALILTFCDILQTLLSEKEKYLESDLMKLTNWVYENYYNIKYAGDEKALMEREDKHLFSRESIKDRALSIGFTQVKIIPFGDKDSIYTCLDSYLPQLDITSSFAEKVVGLYEQYENKYFSMLAVEDLSPSFILFFRK